MRLADEIRRATGVTPRIRMGFFGALDVLVDGRVVFSKKTEGRMPAAGAKKLAGGRPSMLQDVMRGRRTEIDYLNGYVVDEGRRVGVKTPFNEAVVRLVHEHGVGTLKPDPKNLDPLLRMLA